MRILCALLVLIIPILIAADFSNSQENPVDEATPLTQRATLFWQIKDRLDEAYALAIDAVDAELNDEHRQTLNQMAQSSLTSAWQDVNEYNNISAADELMTLPFPRMELRIDTLGEAQSSKEMFLLLMTSLATYQAEHL